MNIIRIFATFEKNQIEFCPYLWNDGDPTADIVQAEASNVFTVNGNWSPGGFNNSEKGQSKGRFAGPGSTNNSNLNQKVEILY